MKQQKNSFFIYIALIHFCSLFSSNEFHQVRNDTPRVEKGFDSHQDTRSSGHCYVYVQVGRLKHFTRYIPVSHIVAEHGSLQLKGYLDSQITPMIRAVTVNNHYCVLPGYASPHGLRDCFAQESQFLRSDAFVVSKLNERMESYCTRVEKVLFDRHDTFRQTIFHDDQVKLARIYADFLQEFYFSTAKTIFEKDVCNDLVKQDVMARFKWGEVSSAIFDGKNSYSSDRQVEQRHAGSINGNLGAVYKALHAGDNEAAYIIGQQRVLTVFSGRLVGKTEKITSVFESYPDLQKVVEQRHFADQAKAAQELAAKQTVVQQNFPMWREEHKASMDFSKFPGPSDALLQRYHAADRDGIVKFHKTLHKISCQQAAFVNSECLTADKKGILFDGCHLQHQLVDEAVSVIDTAISCDLVNNIQDAVVDLANASLISNKGGDIITASRALDACWAIIDFGQKAAQYAYATVTTHAPFIARGVCDGLSESLHGAVDAVCHPIATAKDVANSLVTAGYYLGKLTYEIAEHSAVCDMMETDPERAEQMIREQSCDPSVFFAVYESVKDISTQDIARVGTKTVVDMMLLHGAIKTVSAIAKEAVPVFVRCMRKGVQSVEAAAAEAIPIRCAEEISSLMNNVEKVGGGAAKVITESRMLVENMANALLAEVRAEIIMLQEKFACVQNCIPACAKKGFAEFAGKHIKIPYEHILAIELKWNDVKNTLSGISGFHHDFMGAVEKSGLLKFVRKGVEKNGCYMADILVDGSRVSGKTFFPQSWSREKVIGKIYEAYENFIKSGAIIKKEAGGKYIISGFTNEGIEIEMYITKKAQITTAYPIF